MSNVTKSVTKTNTRIAYVNREAFIREFNKMKKQNHLSTSKVSKASGMSPSYVYHMVSKKEQRPITLKAAKHVGKGLNLSPAQQEEWHHVVLNSSKTDDDFFQPVKVHMNKPHKQHAQALNNTVREIMSAKGLSVKHVVNVSGLDSQHLVAFLKGQMINLSPLDKARLARGLGMNYKELKKIQYNPADMPKKTYTNRVSSNQSATQTTANNKSTASTSRPVQQQPAMQTRPTMSSVGQSPMRPTMNTTVQMTSAPQMSQPKLRSDVLILAERLNGLSTTDVDLVRLFADRLLENRQNH